MTALGGTSTLQSRLHSNLLTTSRREIFLHFRVSRVLLQRLAQSRKAGAFAIPAKRHNFTLAESCDEAMATLPQEFSDIWDRGSYMKISARARLVVLLLGAVPGAGTLGCAGSVMAQSFIENTHLIDVHVGSQRSDAVRQLRMGGYELADGTAVRFDRWYSSNWRDLSFRFLTQFTPGFGALWGLSTGERGPKYQIAPALEVGVLVQILPSANSALTFSASTKLGGRLQELPCMADYGAIGGLQPVNCRLAASTLAPVDTLDYLMRMSAAGESQLSLIYELRF